MVEIERSGNLLKLTPASAAVPVLSGTLTYTHRSMKGGSMKMKFDDVAVYAVVGDSMLVLAGFLRRVCLTLDKAGVPYRFSWPAKPNPPEPDYEHLYSVIPPDEFRYGQEDVLVKMCLYDRGLIGAPTGYGKSHLARAACVLFKDARILICAPGKDIVTGTYGRLSELIPDVGRVGGGYREDGRVVVAVDKSLRNIDVNSFDIFIYDEVHRAAGPETQKSIGGIRNARMYGFSANLRGRGDGADKVLEGMFGPVLATVSYEDAVRHGLVSQIRVMCLSISSCPGRSASALNHNTRVGRKRWMYWRNEARNKAIAECVTKTVPAYLGRENPQILVLVETLEHALYLRKYLPDFKVIYATSDSERLDDLEGRNLYRPETDAMSDKDRERLQLEFSRGSLNKAIATTCWGTGVDFPGLSAVVMAAGHSSDIASTQWGGRVSRLFEGKEFGLVVDCEDAWDTWTMSRFEKRLSMYKKHKWRIV